MNALGKCALLGHRVRFHADGATMSWSCERCGGQSGSKTYESAAQAEDRLVLEKKTC